MAFDEELEQRLAAMGVDRVGMRVVALLPLVHVAWADGVVQPAEAAVVRENAERFGVEGDARLVLENWLRWPPSAATVERGQQLLVDICRPDGFGEEGLLTDVIALAEDVARASGGLFGLKPVSRDEAEALGRIAHGLRIPPGTPWTSPPTVTAPDPTAAAPLVSKRVSITFHTHEFGGLRSRAALVGLQGERCPITREGIVVGRHRSSDVQVAWDGRVSRKHCRLFERDRKAYVRDLDSFTGTWVNGERVQERRLFGGETIGVGSALFRFQGVEIG